MTPCEEKGYEIGQVFERINKDSSYSNVGDILILTGDDGSDVPKFYHLSGKSPKKKNYHMLSNVKRIYPPEEETKDVEVVCEGNTTTWCRRDAKKLGLI